MQVVHLRIDKNNYNQLKNLAEQKNISLNKYINAVLTNHLLSPELDAVNRRYLDFTKEALGVLKTISESALQQMEENTAVLENVKHLLEVYKDE